MAFGEILAPIRPHQRLTVNTNIGTFVVFLRGKVGDISGAGGASFLDDMVVPCVVKKSKEKEWGARLERLREQVEYWTNPENATEKTVEIVELFYDCDC